MWVKYIDKCGLFLKENYLGKLWGRKWDLKSLDNRYQNLKKKKKDN